MSNFDFSHVKIPKHEKVESICINILKLDNASASRKVAVFPLLP